MSNFYGWNIQANSYCDICKLCEINDDIFYSFKSNASYCEILEHADYNNGNTYINLIEKIEPFDKIQDNLELWKKNDLLGSPKIYDYQKYGNISPSTIAYIYTYIKMKNNISDLNNCKNIIEIGGGYGGLCYILSTVLNFDSYTIYDLPEVNLLQNKYLNRLNVKNTNCISPDKEYENNIDLVISCFAWSELNKEKQLDYFNNIINKAKHGFLRLNTCFSGLTIAELNELFKNVNIENDEASNDDGRTLIISW